ncbi:MAG: helix-turn-helix domain-containing protein [Muribaculaceae bacterium]|nr:helix-turn-helix domain-containing protein [Muribaculaceae bacterium]
METAIAPKRARQSEREILRHEFLTIAEVTLLLRMTQRMVYNLIYSGSMRATKITARITVIPKEDFMNMFRINEYNRANGLDRQLGKEIHFQLLATTFIPFIRHN